MVRIFQNYLNSSLLILAVAMTVQSCTLPSRHTKPLSPNQAPATELMEGHGSKSLRLFHERKVARVTATLMESGTADGSGIDLTWVGREEINPLSFDHIVRARSVIRKNWRREWYSSPGIGTPLILLRNNRKDPFTTKMGEALPVTAVVGTNNERPQLFLYDLLDPKNSPSRLSGPQLARDYTAPHNYLLRRAKLIPKIGAIIRADKYMNGIGLYRVEPYDPDKIPVILIHGFKSNSRAWVNLVNQLQADPDLRFRYQFWTFSYPTGIPILYSAMRLRQELQAMRAYYDPSGKNPNLNKFVLVGHSMGGILARLMVSKSSEELLSWLPKPITDLDLPTQVEELAKNMIIFEPQPYVSRTIFIATPHRGTGIATLKIVQMLTSFIRIPLEIQNSFLTALRLNPDISLAEETALIRLKSIENVRPESYFMRSMASQPISPGIPYHSIIGIGKFGPRKPLEETSDLVVSYKSAHLEGTESELTVAGWHNLYKHPKTIIEVGRILKIHK